jgi:hypothetical protein
MNFMVGVGVLFNERSISVMMCAVIEFGNYDDRNLRAEDFFGGVLGL